MSSNLYWRPVNTNQGWLDSDLKFALREYLSVAYIDSLVIGEETLPWLRGVVDSRGQGHGAAANLIKLIEKHGRIEIWEAN